MGREIPLQQMVDAGFDPQRFAVCLREIAGKVESGELTYAGGGFCAQVDDVAECVVFNSDLRFK